MRRAVAAGGRRAGHVDHHTVRTVLEHGAHCLAGAVKGTVQVHVQYTHPGFVRNVGKSIDRADTGVVHQHIDAPKGGHHFIDHGGHGSAVAHVQAACNRAALQPGQGRLRSFQVQVQCHDNGAFLCKKARNGAPHALACTGHQCHFVFESHACSCRG